MCVIFELKHNKNTNKNKYFLLADIADSMDVSTLPDVEVMDTEPIAPLSDTDVMQSLEIASEHHTPTRPSELAECTRPTTHSKVVETIRELGFDFNENFFDLKGSIIECVPEFCARVPAGSNPPMVRFSPTKSWTKKLHNTLFYDEWPAVC